MNVNFKEELSNRILLILCNEFSMNVDEIRPSLDIVMSDYNVDKISTALVSTDIHEKLKLFLSVRMFEGLSKGTLMNYRNELINFSRYIFKPVSDVDVTDIRKYLALYHGDVKATTLNTKLSKIRTFFDWLCDEGYIEINPCKNIKPFKMEKRVSKGLSLEQMELLRMSCNTKREKALLEFLYTTGCRVSEVVNTNINDINFNEKSLYVIGKGDKERKVYFNDRAKILLQDYLGDRTDDCEALFVTSRGANRLGRNSILREISGIGKRLTNPLRISPHTLRHTFASHSADAGIPIQIIQQLMGHVSPTTTVRYSNVSDHTIMQEYRKL